MENYIVQIYFNPDMWLAPWSGDPGRTRVRSSATKYKTEKGAKIALGIARRKRNLLDAKIIKHCKPNEKIQSQALHQ